MISCVISCHRRRLTKNSDGAHWIRGSPPIEIGLLVQSVLSGLCLVCWILPEFKLRKDKYYIVEELKQSLMNILSLSLFVELSKIQKIRHGSSFTTVDGFVGMTNNTILHCRKLAQWTVVQCSSVFYPIRKLKGLGN